MAPDSLDSATKQDWTTDIIMFLLWLCHVSPLAELHPCIHNQRTPNFAVYNHTYIYMYIYIYLYICVCVCVLQGHGEADRRLSPGVGGRGRSPLITFIMTTEYVRMDQEHSRTSPWQRNETYWDGAVTRGRETGLGSSLFELGKSCGHEQGKEGNWLELPPKPLRQCEFDTLW